ncbi:MAG: TrmH family RNA methyltransferase [Maricaulaceae bacterium]
MLQQRSRHIHQTLVTRNAAVKLGLDPNGLPLASPAELDARLPPGAVHQGVALMCKPKEAVSLETLAAPAQGALLMLDQITDPQNVGAIARTAAAFGARGLIVQDRKAPPWSGGMAKAAAGAAETLAHARVVNLSRALERLREGGWRAIGLSGHASIALNAADMGEAVVLVLGAEDKGLRPSVAEHCDTLARIPIQADMESLNVSNAAAIALYEAARRLSGT